MKIPALILKIFIAMYFDLFEKQVLYNTIIRNIKEQKELINMQTSRRLHQQNLHYVRTKGLLA